MTSWDLKEHTAQMSEILCEENFESGDMSRYMFFYIPEAVVDYQLKDTRLPYRVFDRIARCVIFRRETM